MDGLQHTERSYLSVFLELVRRVGNAVPAKCGAKPNLQCGTAPKDSSGVALCCVVFCCRIPSGAFRHDTSTRQRRPRRVAACCTMYVCTLYRMLHVARRYEYRVELLHPTNPVIQPAALLRRCCVRAETASQCFGPGPAACGTVNIRCRLPVDRLNHSLHDALSMLQTRSRTCTHDTVVHVFKVGTAHVRPHPSQ
jgi:hypothetical protein